MNPVSAYLLRRIRSYDEAVRDIRRKQLVTSEDEARLREFERIVEGKQ